MNYYEILQISDKASEDEIKKAYQELVRKHHPDKTQNEGSEHFLKIDKAFKTLRDKHQRAIYDSEQFQDSSSHLIIHENVSIVDFTSQDELNKVYKCKCGSLYSLNCNDYTKGQEVILSCDECSLNILVKC